MRAADLRKLENLFGNLTRLRRYMVDAEAAWSDGSSCGCTPVDGRHELAGQCKPTTPGGLPPEHCRTVTHVTARAVLHQTYIPVEHLTDDELDVALAGLAALVDQAPRLSEVEFVTRMQQILHVTPDRLPVRPSEETPAP